MDAFAQCEEESLLEPQAAKHPRFTKTTSKILMDRKDLTIAGLALLNIILFMAILLPLATSQLSVFSAKQVEQQLPNNIAIVPELPLKPMKFHWNTAYSSKNDTESDALWDKINTAHGHIAMNHEWAAKNHWLPSMPVPGSTEKGLYLLESYHQLHCLKIVRKVFLESVNRKPLSYPVHHVRHCFDYFRQFIMCHADNTPLYTEGKHTSGDGQVHMCKDWSALRDYATEYSACFKDRAGDESLRDQFGHCDERIDGLEGLQ